MRFNPPPEWPATPEGWTPPPDWQPDPSLPPMPPGWQLWVPEPGDDHQPAVADQPDPDVTTDATEQVAALQQRIAELEHTIGEYQRSRNAAEFDDHLVMLRAGVYDYNHPLATAVEYKDRLADLRRQKKDQFRGHTAIATSTKFTWNGSLRDGQKMANQFSKLMLRAYNAELDNCLRSMRASNHSRAIDRLTTARSNLERFGAMMALKINDDYHQLCVTELELVADYQAKRKAEQDQRREQRAILREQKKLAAEVAEKQQELDKEQEHYETAINKLRQQGNWQQVEELEGRLEEIRVARAEADYRVANVKAGYVYVISNIGAFGEGIVKIGLTRRLDPQERIRELSSASVPFTFDVHAMYFSDDAVALERELHQHFADRRLNHVSTLREFFFATPREVLAVLQAKAGSLLDFTEQPEASEYWRSTKSWPPTHQRQHLHGELSTGDTGGEAATTGLVD